MSDDSMSTSHPILKSVNSAADIEDLFDSIEITKSTAILKMADYYMEQTTGIKNTTLSNIVVRKKDLKEMNNFLLYFFLVFSSSK